MSQKGMAANRSTISMEVCLKSKQNVYMVMPVQKRKKMLTTQGIRNFFQE